LRVRVQPDRGNWLAWAHGAGVHPKVTGFIEASPDAIGEGKPSPRSWTYVGGVLAAWEADRAGDLLTLVSGLVGLTWGIAFLQFYEGNVRSLSGPEVLEEYPRHRAEVQLWVAQGRLDCVVASTRRLQDHLKSRTASAPPLTRDQERCLRQFLADLPGDLRRDARAWLVRNGFRRVATSPTPGGPVA
jgi:hypothetical protein